MKIAYKIEVSITINPEASFRKPYYWILWSYCGNDWCNDCCGWATTPEIAWAEAMAFYHSFKEPLLLTH